MQNVSRNQRRELPSYFSPLKRRNQRGYDEENGVTWSSSCFKGEAMEVPRWLVAEV